MFFCWRDCMNNRITTAVKFSPNGDWLAFSGSDGSLHLWDAKGRRPLWVFDGHDGIVTSLSFSPNSHYLASASEDTCINIWDLNARQLAGTLTGHDGWVTSIIYCEKTGLLASGGTDRHVCLWSPLTKKRLWRSVSFTMPIVSLDFHPSGDLLAAACVNDNTTLLRTGDGSEYRALREPCPVGYEYEGQRQTNVVRFCPKCGLLAVAGRYRDDHRWEDRAIAAYSYRRYNYASGQHLIYDLVCDSICDLQFDSLQHGLIAYGTKEGFVRLVHPTRQDEPHLIADWQDQDTYTYMSRLVTLGKHSGEVRSLSFSRQYEMLASSGADSAIKIWDMGTKSLYAEVS